MTHDPNNPPPPGWPSQQPPQQGGFAQPPAQQGFGQPPAQGGFGQPPQQGGFGQPPAGFGQPPQQGGFGQPPQQGGFGAPPAGFGQAPQQGGFGQPPAGGFGGQPQGGFGQPPQQGGFGGQPPAFGQPPQSFGSASSSFSGGTGTAVGFGMGRMLIGCVPSALFAIGMLAYAGYQVKNAMAPFQNGTVPGVPGAAATPADPDDAMNAKLDRYITNCINLFTERASDSRHRYLSWANEQTGPTGEERNIFGLYTFPIEPSRCTNAITEAANVGPDDTQLEAAAQQYATTLLALAPLLVEANNYYEQQNYRDDAMAKGKQLHPRLLAAFSAFDTAATSLRREVNVRQDAVTDRLLARLQNDPSRKLEYLVRLSMKTAKILITLSDASRIEDAQIVGVNADQLSAIATQYENTVNEMTAFASSHPDQVSRYGSYSSFQSESNDFLVTVKKFTRRVKNHDRFSDSDLHVIFRMEMGYSVEGAPQQLWREYDSLVGAYNSLR